RHTRFSRDWSSDVCSSDLDTVLMVGGASRMPCVVSLAAELFGKRPQDELHPDEAVAQGAAIQAALKAGEAAVEDMVVTDVAPFKIGRASCRERVYVSVVCV